MKRIVILILALLSSVGSVAYGQNLEYAKMVSSMRVFPQDTLGAGNPASVTQFTEHNGYIFAATAGKNIMRSADSGKTWQELAPQFGLYWCVALTVTPKGTVLASGDYVDQYNNRSFLLRSTDNGNTWNAINDYVGKYFAQTMDGGIISGGLNSLYKSTDDGLTWFMVADTSILHQNSAVSMVTTKKGTVLAYVCGGTPSFYGILRSTDNGISWEYTNKGLELDPYGNCAFVNFAVATNNDIYGVCDAAGVYRSTDDGESWEQVTGPYPIQGAPFLRGSSILVSDNLGILVANGNNTMGGGILQSVDGGIHWNTIGFNNLPVGALMQLSNTKVLANVNGGIYILSFDVATGVEDAKSGVPNHFSLSQNYPNPFNPSTKINFQIPKYSNVTLKVYDALGREVATLVNEEKSAGSYSVTFNANNLPSGIYFYRLQTGNFTETKKMILVK